LLCILLDAVRNFLVVRLLVKRLELDGLHSWGVDFHRELLRVLVDVGTRDFEVFWWDQVGTTRSVVHAVEVHKPDDSPKLAHDGLQKLFNLVGERSMEILAAGIFADLGREVAGDAHIEHNFLDLTHLFRICVELFLCQSALDLLSNDDHLSGFLLEWFQVVECASDLLLIELSRILLCLDEPHHSSGVVGSFFLAQILHLFFFLGLGFDGEGPMSFGDCVLEQLKEVVPGFVAKSVVNGASELRSLWQITKILLADVHVVIDDIGWLLLLVVDSYKNTILL
jgi:hypothetical protein